MGNIVEIMENGRTSCRYEYDALGRLTREDNTESGKTRTYSYDNNGNILARYEYTITAKPTAELYLLDSVCTAYSYAENSDQLMAYGAETFAYDAIGNPTTYRGKSATWQLGRQLAAFDGNTFTYNAGGRRTKKNSITFSYDSAGNLIKQSNGLEFFYDHTGIFAIKHGGSTYYCRKNAQNDVRFLLDSSGSVVVKYSYNAWGNCKVLNASGTEITDANHIGNLNPFRYRSYYYDTETKLYYLQSRYYDPEIGRFITIDDISYLNPDAINGLNLYAYCGNNPVNRVDATGHAWWNPFTWDWGAIGRGLLSVAAIVGGIALCFVPGAQAIGAGLIIAGAGGLIGGAIGMATGVGFSYGWDIGTIIGGTIGLIVAFPNLLNLTLQITIPTIVNAGGALMMVGATITIPAGAAIATAAGAGLLMFASQNRPGNNRTQNKQFNDAARKAGFDPNNPSDKDILREPLKIPEDIE